MRENAMKVLLLIGIISTSLSITACSSTDEIENEVKESNKIEAVVEEENLKDQLKGKYIYKKTEYEPGDILYFKDDKEIISIYSYHADIYNIKDISSTSDKITYKLETSPLGEDDNIVNCTLNIEKDTEEDTVSMTWIYEDGSSSESNLKIYNATQCVEAIYKDYPNYKHDKDWNNLGLTTEIFNQVYSSIKKDNTSVNNTDASKSDKNRPKDINKLSDEKALQICKSKLKGIIDLNYLHLGDNKYGMDKIVNYNNINYYCVYIEDEECTADYRFCINENDGSVFYEDVSAFGKLTPIDTYIASLNQTTETNKEVISKEEAEGLVRKLLTSNGSYIPSHIEVDHEEGDLYVVHVYDVIDDGDEQSHIATSGWYYVNKYTGDISSM